MITAKILADSTNGCNRLTTFELTYPRFIHSELLTHRVFSRNAASSRAIPIQKMIDDVINNPAIPSYWGKNRAGMEANEEITNTHEAMSEWLIARNQAVDAAKRMHALGIHKQTVNRVLEPFLHITTILSGTHFDNFFHLRDSEHAQPELATLARSMRQLYESHTPEYLVAGDWHLPLISPTPGDPLFVDPNEPEIANDDLGLVKISMARCARVSYLTHDGVRDLSKDLELHNRLTESGHWSPAEHPAQAFSPFRSDIYPCSGNYVGFKQYRKFFDNEHFGSKML